jgi:TetR/AcrR family transcriptional regulator, lmrAB and yxaGH operons repressor
MPTDARTRMIETAALLLAAKGVHGASFSEVLAASGAPRGSVYHHFPGGKEQLVGAAIDVARERAEGALRALHGRPAAEVAEGFVGLWRAVLVASDFSAGCAVLAVTVEVDGGDLVARAADVFRAWRSALVLSLVAGGVPAERAPGLAALLVAGCEGAVVVARAERSLDAFEAAAAEIVAAVRASTEKVDSSD